MPYPLFRADSLDDLMREVYDDLLASGSAIAPARGPALERTGVLLELSNPRARLSRTETRGRVFSCFGELCWYLAGSSDAGFVRYYVPDYPGSDSRGQIVGAYGPRLFGGGADSQVSRVRRLLASKVDTRQAVVQIFDRTDLETDSPEVPCTCTLQFLARNRTLDLIVHMRSNDAYLGMPHDVFSFTMLQEIIAADLSLELGTYRHFVGSLHLYKRNLSQARNFLGEGWQSLTPMPRIPPRPWDAIPDLLTLEETIRTRGTADEARTPELPEYWADVARLLLVFRLTKDRDRSAAERVRSDIRSETYKAFVDARIARLK